MPINKVIISGNLVRDAEQHGNLASFTVAVNSRRRDDAGDWVDSPNFIDCKILGERAGKLVGYLTKGKKVAIEGLLDTDIWETKDGQKRSKLTVIVREIEFMSAREERQQAPRDAYEAEEDIPF